jgi:hypothetical protein
VLPDGVLSDDDVLVGELVDEDEKPPTLPPGLLARMRADPTHAPEYLAVAAVETFGPEADRWVRTFRAKNPTVTEAYVALSVRARFVRLSSYSGAAAGVAGAVGAILDIGVLAWNQARMLLHLAAVYGFDPTDPERAAEMLVLRGIQTKLDTARTAVDVARRKQDATALLQRVPTGRGRGLATLTWELARMAGMTAAKRAVLKIVPFAAVPLGALANASATKKLADEAARFYHRRRHGGGYALPPPPQGPPPP